MAEINWEKFSVAEVGASTVGNRLKFGVVSVALIGVIGFLLISGTASNGRYFITVSDLLARPELVSKTVKITGAVIGSTIQNDPDAKLIRFTMSNLTDDAATLEKEGGLSKALHLAVTDPTSQKLKIVVANQAMPDLLRDEAQAILTGKLGTDGVFYADEILLKCPSKYQSELPKQAVQQVSGS